MAETEREERHFLEHRGEHRQEGIAQPEDDRRTEDGDVQFALGSQYYGFAVALGAQVFGRALGVGIERAHVHQATDAGSLAGGNDLLRQFDMGFGEVAAVGQYDIAAVQDADQVDHGIVTAHQLGQGLFATDIGFRHGHARLDDQRLGAFAATGRDGDLDAALRQAIDDVGTDETATPQQQDFLDVHVNPGNLNRKTRILRQFGHFRAAEWPPGPDSRPQLRPVWLMARPAAFSNSDCPERMTASPLRNWRSRIAGCMATASS